jgi:acetyl-CoA carboxylase carboxyl transferase subunit alpha
VAVIVGEGGSGGALGIAAGNTVLMLEHAIYAVAEPGSAASILFRDSARAKDVAAAMKITAQDLLQLKVIDGVIEEPLGGAHRQPEKAIAAVGAAIAKALDKFANMSPEALKKQRRERYYAIGRELPSATPAKTTKK